MTIQDLFSKIFRIKKILAKHPYSAGFLSPSGGAAPPLWRPIGKPPPSAVVKEYGKKKLGRPITGAPRAPHSGWR